MNSRSRIRDVFLTFVRGTVFVVMTAAGALAWGYSPGSDDKAVEAGIVDQANRERTSRGLGPLDVEAGLTALARRHARAMAAAGFFAHVDREGLDPDGRRLRYDPGLFTSAYAENIVAVGGKEPPSIAGRCVQCWMDSPGHRGNLLNPVFTHTGVGVARSAEGKVLAVQVFATPLARLDAFSPRAPRVGASVKVEFTFLGGSKLRKLLRVFVTLPDPFARFFVSGNRFYQGEAYLVPSWRGNRFSVQFPAQYGAGLYRIGLGTPDEQYPPFYTITVK